MSFGVLCVLLLALCVSSLPVELDHVASGSGGVSEPIQALQFAAASYCNPELLKDWRCSICGNHTAGFVPAYITPSNKKDTFGFVGSLGSTIIVSFRGSQSLANWITNLKLIHIDASYAECPECKIHGGFRDAYDVVKNDLTAAVKALSSFFNTNKIVVTGHSLGGALATLCAMDLTLHHGMSVDIITFGSPRVGNIEFAEFFAQRISSSERWVHENDIVPHLPPASIPFTMGTAHHVATEFWEHGGKDVQCDGTGEDMSCANSVSVLRYSIPDHLTYLGQATGCSDKLDDVAVAWSDDEKAAVWPSGHF